MRRTRQLIAYRRDVVIGLCHLYKCTPLNVLWEFVFYIVMRTNLHALSITIYESPQYCYDAYLIYWRGMQVDGERLFTTKGPVMVKESNNYKNGLLRGQYLAIKVT